MMKSALLAGLGLLAVGTLPAAAADLARPVAPAPIYKAPPAPIMFNWTGFYIGGNGGYSWGKTDSTVTGLTPTSPVSFGISPTGWLGGGQAGYNWQGAGSVWVFGVEGDFQATSETATTTCVAAICVPNASVKTRYPYFGTFRGRIGYDMDHWLFYITGGLAYAETYRGVGQLGVVSYEEKPWRVGFAVGGGVEYALSEHWSIKGEYIYLDYGTSSLTIAGSGPLGAAPLGPIGLSTRWTDSIGRGGINFRF